MKSTISQQYETVLQTKPETLASIDYHISNPRYVDLSSEAELKANEQTDLNSKKEETSSAAEESSKVQNQVLATTNSISKKRSSSNQTSYFEDLKRFSSDTYQKLVNAVKFGAHPDTYTGLSMGMNASLSSAQNNFGGFHAGLTNLKPVSDYFSVLTEFKFFYRNNGGYTVNDIYTRTLNRWTDNSSLTHQTIYNYQMDSTVRTYNFKNFYSLELPIMMQLNDRSFAIYGGANLAYNFKLNVNEKTRNYVIDKHDTMSNSFVYSFPADKGSQLQRSDFSSRFGLGYTMGASYQFSPQLYVDVRMSQNVWDNMKTNAAREISNGFFKVPNVQFSLGYRFRKFVPDN
ncbi:MAG: outer membrane beta-barrel protein [Bacteroidetes bacterium]|nr:outer membrane beta-barrel protein [Bacteroidota bacterium]